MEGRRKGSRSDPVLLADRRFVRNQLWAGHAAKPYGDASVSELAHARPQAASWRYGTRARRGTGESDGAPDGPQTGIRRRRKGSVVSSRASQPLPADTERSRLRTGSRAPRRLRKMVRKIRQRSVRERSRIGRRPGAGGLVSGPLPEAGGRNGCSGPAWKSALRVARSGDRKQTAVFGGGAARSADARRLPRREPSAA